MPRDNFTEITHRSWGGRIASAFKGLLFGGILVVASFPVLFLNEGRAVRTHQTLQEGAGAVVSVAADAVDPKNEGRLVHVSGGAAPAAELTDPEFALSAEALVLRRSVEMYQWKEAKRSETHKKLGGGEETRTTYSYEARWLDRVESSKNFHDPANHRNPAEMPVSARTIVSERTTLGAFALPAELVRQLNDFQSFPAKAGPEAIPHGARANDGGYYIGANPAAPEIGDVRITFERVPPGEVSVVAKQTGASFSPYTAKTGKTIEMIRTGAHEAAAMFAAAERENRFITWLIRAGGFVLMFFGVLLLLRPFVALADVVPFIGSIVGFGTGVVAFVASLVGSTLTAAVAWFFYRPVLALSLVALAVALGWFILHRRRARAA